VPVLRPQARERRTPVQLRPLTRTLLLWGAAAAGYIAIGVFFIDFMFSLVVAIVYLLITVWILPAAVRRFL
jgi:hypothetical protein